MKLAVSILALIAACVIGGSVLAVGYGVMPLKPESPHPVCLISHKAVILIPAVCGKDELCERPIVAELCDRVEMDAQ